MAQIVKNLPAMEETQVQSLGQEDPLEKGMAIHSSILAWIIPWTDEPGGLQSRILYDPGRIIKSWKQMSDTKIQLLEYNRGERLPDIKFDIDFLGTTRMHRQ